MDLRDWLKENNVQDVTERLEEVGSGCAFFAIKGTKVDGADFIPEAIQKGAVAIVADHEVNASVPVRVVKDVRRELAHACSLLWPSENLKKVAVTGTNGKTSTVYFVQQLMNAAGVKAVSLGTIGMDGVLGHTDGGMTTLPPKELAQTLAKYQAQGVQVVAMEASSHGLDQGRLVGQKLAAGAFTNLTRDHLDYHKTAENYFKAKQNLFTEILTAGNFAVLNADIPEYPALKEMAEARGLQIISYGKRGETLRLAKWDPWERGQKIMIAVAGKKPTIEVPVFGEFQAMNLLAALGLCFALGIDWERLLKALPGIKAPAGRLELIGQTATGGLVFVDYAHTPDGLEQVLKTLRKSTPKRLSCVFGCGGDRDKGKRPQMGKIANKLADRIFITDDNPRSEDPAAIRAEIMAACPKGIEKRTRFEAIRQAVGELQKGDVVVLAGKGHETGQKIGNIEYPFNDKIEAQLAIKRSYKNFLWSANELHIVLNTEILKSMNAWGITFNSQEVKVGDLFIALTGGARDGHAFVRQAVERGAAACIVNHLIEGVPEEKQIVVLDTKETLMAFARFSRMRSSAHIAGITGSSGKTTVKEILGACLAVQGKTYITPANLNNNLGVPLTLANMPADTEYAVIEMGISHPGEMAELSDFVRPDVSVITNIQPAHQAFFKTPEITAAEKAHIFDFQNKNGSAILNTETLCAKQLMDAVAAASVRHIVKFGFDEEANCQLKTVSVNARGQEVKACLFGEEVNFKMNFIGEHYAVDAMAVLAAVDALGASIVPAVQVLQVLLPMAGRGEVQKVVLNHQKITLIDDAYNANPGSMKAAIKMLGFYPGRKIAVLGDMLELGEEGEKNHLDLAPVLAQNGIQAVFACGVLMQKMLKLLPDSVQTKWAKTPEELLTLLKGFIQTGDVVLVKSSHGTGLWRLVEQMKGK
ncbi:MAG: UDP-N-acetylmuramoyl-L-alanyl-D-glutamate--2,6-diaminopimelate ligase [Alphaproteobacteria bacterium]